MRLFVDLDTNALITGAANKSPVTRVTFKRGDSSFVDVVFSRVGVVQELDVAATGKFGLKVTADYPGDFIVSDFTWEKNGTGTNTYYRFEPSFNTIELNAALVDGVVSQYVADQAARYALAGLTLGTIVGQESDTTFWKVIDIAHLGDSAGWSLAPQKSSVTLMGEIEWLELGARASTGTWAALVSNDVIKGDEGIPSPGTPPYPTPDELQAMFGNLFTDDEVTISSDQEITLTKAAPETKHQTLTINLGAGSGPYLVDAFLDPANCTNGNKTQVILNFTAASTNPSVEIRDTDGAGTLICSFAASGNITRNSLFFTFRNGAWTPDQNVTQ